MKLSFSTKGWRGVGWTDFCRMAQEFGFSGIELHDPEGMGLTGPDGPIFPGAANRTVRALIDEEGWDALWTSGRRKTLDRAALADAEACAGAILKQNGTRLPLIKTAGHGGCRIIFRTDKIR